MLKGFKAQFLVKSFFRRSSYCTSDSKAWIILDTFNLVLERVIEWLIVNEISIVKMRSNKTFVKSH